MSGSTLRVGFVPGVTTDTWARAWRERPDRTRLDLVAQEESEAEGAVRSGRLDMALVRLPVERAGLHLVRLYDEVPVVVAPRDHPVAAYDEIDVADLDGTDLVVLPMSVARLRHRRDTVQRPVRGLPPTTIALIWLVERDDDLTQAFVGVVRGRTARSSRG